MKFQPFLLLAFAPLAQMNELNSYEILMFYDMYRSDWDQNGEEGCKIASRCKDCNFDEFIAHIDRFGTVDPDGQSVPEPKTPDPEDVAGWDSSDFVYDAKKLLGGLWTVEDNERSRPGHPTVVERLVDRMAEVRQEAEPGRLAQIIETMEVAHLSRRKAQAEDMLSFIDGRLSSVKLGKAQTQSIPFFQGGEFDEFDSTATIESVQRTKRPAMRQEIMDIAKDINSGSVSKRSLDWDKEDKLVKRAFGEGMIVMSLQRGIDSLKMPVRRKC